ncbi:response regulator [Shinella sp. M31]|uniref:response regulator n=1 Tax=Shinella sp. M31 TaxID=3368615 RepID=UPI003BA1257E
MGEMDGLARMARLGEMTSRPTPVIVITAVADEVLRTRAKAQGCYAFLLKPFDAEAPLKHVLDAIGDR